MLKGLTFLSSLALAAVLSLPTMVQAEPNADTVVARINGEEITLGHMIIAHATLPQQYQQLPPAVLYNAILDQLVQQTALKQSRTDEVPRQVTLSLENERRSLLAADVIEKIMANAAKDGDVQSAYDAKYADGFGEDEYHAAHILVETEDEAKAIKADLDSGADFAATAMEKSTGPSGPSGGDLGWFGIGAMVPEFETAVVSMDPGQVSDPIKTQFGWHVIILNEKRKQSAPELDTVRAELTGKLQEDAVEAKVEELTAAATIERLVIEDLQPEIIQNLGLLQD
ncbi:MAG: peptidyl-prolyl cis-trans isomerase C [Paracoccaceae bacterium]|jgi:peptidyl-prolyl cis-trans isomerase C